MQEARPTPALDDSHRSVLDMASLDQLRQLDPTGGSGFLSRVLGTYVRSLERHEAEAQQARQAAQWDALARTAHTLKSASASVGALTFSQICADIEGRIRRQELDQLDPLLDRFFQEAILVREAVQAQLGASAAAGSGAPSAGGKGSGSGPSSLDGSAAS
ncbi:Hpt domain-containing protein [Ideonella sp.]|uniref:Hpt domain-containing protein n=1 Tax=Ideonella sp. TaxID=1929293 RepID=UPI002E3495DE|nr:Hpt domain-containing protein [Ideonella sp.]